MQRAGDRRRSHVVGCIVLPTLHPSLHLHPMLCSCAVPPTSGRVYLPTPVRSGLAMQLQSSCWKELNTQTFRLNYWLILGGIFTSFSSGNLTIVILSSPFYRSRTWGSGTLSVFSQCPMFMQMSYWKCLHKSNVIRMKEGDVFPVTRILWNPVSASSWQYASHASCMFFPCALFLHKLSMVGQLTPVSVKLKLKIYWFVCSTSPPWFLIVLHFWGLCFLV